MAGLPAVRSVHEGLPPTANVGRRGVWLYGDVDGGAKGNTNIGALWEFDLLEGVVAEARASTANLSDSMAGYSATITYTDGSSEQVEGGMGDVASSQVFSAAVVSDQTITVNVQSALSPFGITQVQVSVLHPFGAAVKVVARVDDPSALAGKAELLRTAVVGQRPVYEGVYLEVSDATGPFVVMSSSYRTGAGRLWIRPSLGVDLGTAHG